MIFERLGRKVMAAAKFLISACQKIHAPEHLGLVLVHADDHVVNPAMDHDKFARHHNGEIRKSSVELCAKCVEFFVKLGVKPGFQLHQICLGSWNFAIISHQHASILSDALAIEKGPKAYNINTNEPIEKFPATLSDRALAKRPWKMVMRAIKIRGYKDLADRSYPSGLMNVNEELDGAGFTLCVGLPLFCDETQATVLGYSPVELIDGRAFAVRLKTALKLFVSFSRLEHKTVQNGETTKHLRMILLHPGNEMIKSLMHSSKSSAERFCKLQLAGRVAIFADHISILSDVLEFGKGHRAYAAFDPDTFPLTGTL